MSIALQVRPALDRSRAVSVAEYELLPDARRAHARLITRGIRARIREHLKKGRIRFRVMVPRDLVAESASALCVPNPRPPVRPHAAVRWYRVALLFIGVCFFASPFFTYLRFGHPMLPEPQYYTFIDIYEQLWDVHLTALQSLQTYGVILFPATLFVTLLIHELISIFRRERSHLCLKHHWILGWLWWLVMMAVTLVAIFAFWWDIDASGRELPAAGDTLNNLIAPGLLLVTAGALLWTVELRRIRPGWMRSYHALAGLALSILVFELPDLAASHIWPQDSVPWLTYGLGYWMFRGSLLAAPACMLAIWWKMRRAALAWNAEGHHRRRWA